MSENAKQKKTVTLDMLKDKVAEASKLLSSLEILRDNGMDIPSILESQEAKSRKGLEFWQNTDINTQEDIDEAWSKFQGHRGRIGRTPFQIKCDYVAERKNKIRAKLENLAKEYQALMDFSDNLSSAAGPTLTFMLEKAVDKNGDFSPVKDSENVQEYLDNESKENGEYFAIFRKESESSRRGTLVGGYLFHAKEGSISDMVNDLT